MRVSGKRQSILAPGANGGVQVGDIRSLFDPFDFLSVPQDFTCPVLAGLFDDIQIHVGQRKIPVQDCLKIQLHIKVGGKRKETLQNRLPSFPFQFQGPVSHLIVDDPEVHRFSSPLLDVGGKGLGFRCFVLVNFLIQEFKGKAETFKGCVQLVLFRFHNVEIVIFIIVTERHLVSDFNHLTVLRCQHLAIKGVGTASKVQVQGFIKIMDGSRPVIVQKVQDFIPGI